MKMSQSNQIDQEVFRQIFIDHWSGFKERHRFYSNSQYEEVVQKMLGCGTESGGYSEYQCMDCGFGLRRICFTCKSSFCLSCTKVYVDNFVSQVSKILHPGVKYRHMVLTVPEQFWIYFYRDRFRGILLSSLMRTGYECLEDVASHLRRHRLKIGSIVVVQTHGRSGHFNPHLHILLTSGGIDESRGKWEDLNYFPHPLLRRKWQYHLFSMLKRELCSLETDRLIDSLWKKYRKGLVVNVKRGRVPEKCRGLAKYLAKYLASPPISVRRIVSYTGSEVTYWYNDHASKSKKVETVDVYTFIGRMVQHVFPKGFQRVRYYGLQATKTFSKWRDQILSSISRVKETLKGVYEIVKPFKYRERYQEGSGKDPFVCPYCGKEMVLSIIYHPKYGVIYDELEEIKRGKYEPKEVPINDRGRGCTVRPSTEDVQLSLFPLPV